MSKKFNEFVDGKPQDLIYETSYVGGPQKDDIFKAAGITDLGILREKPKPPSMS